MGAGASFNIPDEAKIRERFLRITSPGAYANVLQIQDILPENLTVDMYNVAYVVPRTAYSEYECYIVQLQNLFSADTAPRCWYQVAADCRGVRARTEVVCDCE